jgi:uncharacterized protein YbjQ (UPF0145 family)
MKDSVTLRLPVTTCESVPGKRIVEYLGLARGCTTRGAALQEDVIAQMKNWVGGEIPEYTKVFAECREEALDRMLDHARSLGANAIVGVRFCTSEIVGGAAELLAYGTAVLIEDRDET